MKKRIMLPCIAMALLAGCGGNHKAAPQKETFPVTSPVVMDTIYETDYVADIAAVQYVELRARTKGILEKIHVDEGAAVQKGQLLFTFNAQGYRQKLVRAAAIVSGLQADAKAAAIEIGNIRALIEKKVVAKSELDMALAKQEALEAKIKEAQSDVAAEELKLSFTEIRAPFDGVMDRIPKKAGSLVKEGTLLSTISDSREVFAYFNIAESEYLDAAFNREQQRVSMVLANNTLLAQQGVIETAGGTVDKNTGNIVFRARFANPQQVLRHGSSGKVRIGKPLAGAMVIPQKCTFEIQDKLYVYVVDNSNKVQLRSIVPQLRIPQLYVVQSGLSLTDRVLYEGIQNVQQGEEIIPRLISPQKVLAQLKGGPKQDL